MGARSLSINPKRLEQEYSNRNEVQLGATNRGVINHAHTMSGSQHVTSPQVPSEQSQGIQGQNVQSQQLKHTRFPSFNPSRPDGADFHTASVPVPKPPQARSVAVAAAPTPA
ncbi:hypothetical protein KCU92_g9849, partial [Aureobasidium melanogenum]